MKNMSEARTSAGTTEQTASLAVPSQLFPVSIFAISGLVVLSVFRRRKREEKRRKLEKNVKVDPAVAAALERKRDFLSRAGDAYGYSSCPSGHIDTWRQKEHPRLIGPVNDKKLEGNTDDEQEVYLDYAGASLPSQSQLENILKSSQNHVLANPHSTGPAASRSKVLVEQAKKRVMDHFHCHPGRLYGLQGDNAVGQTTTPNTHPGYELIFTSGATESLRMVAERFPWFHCESCDNKSVLVYPQNSHTSVVGMRGPAQAGGASFSCQPLSTIAEASSQAEIIDGWANQNSDDTCTCSDTAVRNLLVMPAECNFGGTCLDVESVVAATRLTSLRQASQQWLTMVDLAKAASTGAVNLQELDPDFACISFYKMFGEPTGLGALFVKRTSVDLLTGSRNTASYSSMHDPQKAKGFQPTNHYFGGGSVDSIIPGINFVAPRSEPSSLVSLVNGTMHFRGIANLLHGFDELNRIGGMAMIKRHSTSLAAELTRRLSCLKHESGNPAIIIYGAWSSMDNRLPQRQQPGPTVAFNVLRSDGSFVGYNEVSKLAAINRPPLQLRTGCFCNPGGCQEALELSDDQVLDNYLAAGHVCGDQIDIVNDKPTGAVRASFGKDSTWEDMDALVMFLEKMFVNKSNHMEMKQLAVDGDQTPALPTKMVLAEMYIFPIKSCAAQRVKRWKMTTCGRFAFDREFALVDTSGHAMRLQAYPRMGFLEPSIDAEKQIMTVTAPGCEDLILDLNQSECRDGVEAGSAIVKVCGNRCGGRLWGDSTVSEWFSSFLSVQCWLARHYDGQYLVPASENTQQTPLPSISLRQPGVAFANEQPQLLISDHAVSALNEILSSQGQKAVTTRHFRPNLVVKAPPGDKRKILGTNPEDNWSRLLLNGSGKVKLKAMGPCARCSMVDVDPTSGMKGNTLRALADYRRQKGQITFGIFLCGDSNKGDKEEILLKEGDTFDCL